MVVHICKQLPAACENCAGGGPGKPLSLMCFDLATTADDATCAKFALDHSCKVDQGGNTCGSIDCSAAGCDTPGCLKAQDWGDPNPSKQGGKGCNAYLTSCACR